MATQVEILREKLRIEELIDSFSSRRDKLEWDLSIAKDNIASFDRRLKLLQSNPQEYFEKVKMEKAVLRQYGLG